MVIVMREKAWVIFSGQTEIPYLRLLRNGFRHCFIVLRRGEHWITLDPLSNKTEIELHHLPEDFNLPEWLQNRGHIVVEAELKKSHLKPLPLALFTCTEAVKRVLGINEWRVMTPWQLYKHLTA